MWGGVIFEVQREFKGLNKGRNTADDNKLCLILLASELNTHNTY